MRSLYKWYLKDRQLHNFSDVYIQFAYLKNCKNPFNEDPAWLYIVLIEKLQNP